MRAAALLCGLLLAGGAAAAPAKQADVGKVMQVLGMQGLGEQGATAMIDLVPSLSALKDAPRQCATRQVGLLMEAQLQGQITRELGDDGAALMQEWTRFLATPAGQDMGRTFRAISPLSKAEGAAMPEVSEAHKTEIAGFMGTPAFQRVIGGISADGEVPDDIGQRMADVLQRECSIAFDPEEIS